MTQPSKYQSFVAEEVHRTYIKNAPYNPRTISDKAFKMLKKNLKNRGLMTTLVWNKQTGNLVSGHQRLKALDALEGTEDYYLTVAVVNLSEKEEKEQNIFFNSTTPQGQFDFELLNTLLDDVDPFAAGFDEADLNIIGYDLSASNLITDAQAETENEILDFFAPAEKKPATADEIKAEKNRITKQAAERMDEGERYVSILFDSYADKAAWMRRMGFNADDLFIRADLLNRKLKGNG